MDVAPKGHKGFLTAIVLLHDQQILELFDLILLVAHVVVNDAHPVLPMILRPPVLSSRRPVPATGVGGRKRGLALLVQPLAHIVKIAHYQALEQEAVTVVKKQRQYAPALTKGNRPSRV